MLVAAQDSPITGTPSEASRQTEQQPFLSPDRTLTAATVWPCCGREGPPYTYIADVAGTRLTTAHLGSFRSWSPDSKKVLIYRSNTNNARDREIYVLGTDDSYSSLGLPIGVIDAQIVPDGRIAYVLTPNATDHSDLWVRDVDGTDRLVLKGDNDIFAWLRWSPSGDAIAFLRSNMDAQSPEEARQLWLVRPDGTDARRVAQKVLWDYPPVWSPDGETLLFAVQENPGELSISMNEEALESNVWEYAVTTGRVRKVTAFTAARVLHPGYSADGRTILFVSDHTGSDELWAVTPSGLRQLTDDTMPKRYPIMP